MRIKVDLHILLPCCPSISYTQN